MKEAAMTMPDDPNLQLAKDMLQGMKNQRDNSQNECVQLAAQLMAAQRREAEKDAKIAELESKLKELAPAPVPNGHDHAEPEVRAAS